MPLPRSAPRKLLHMRDITLRGYEREDGMFDIEGHMTDAKTYSLSAVENPPGLIAGDLVHNMWLRLTVTADMEVHACETDMEAVPYGYCRGAASSMQRLIGLRIGKGFIKEAMSRLGGAGGCTHLRELLQPVATVALQTINKHVRAKITGTREVAPDPSRTNSCYSYAEGSPVLVMLAQRAAESYKAPS